MHEPRLVERLRKAGANDTETIDAGIFDEAADEIERLRLRLVGEEGNRDKLASIHRALDAASGEHEFAPDTPEARHIQRIAEERDKFRDQVRDTCRRAEKAEAACQKAVDVIYRVEGRCMAVDGPVTPTLEEMSEQELRELYLALAEIVDKDNFARLTTEGTGETT